MQKVQIFLILFVLSMFAISTIITPVQFQHDSRGAPSPIPSIPSHLSAIGKNNSAPENVNLFSNSEPAPIGITDYGLGSSGAYTYNTSAFLGIAQISSLITSAPTSSGGPNMTFQLNVVLPFTSQDGRQLVYWLQNVIVYDTSNHEAYFENNVWNMSSPSAQMASAGISGSGKVYNFGNGGSYYAASTASYASISLPATVQFLINSTIDSQNEPKVYFQYNYGTGWQTYDVVTFPVLTSQSLDSGLVVDGTKYNPYGTYYDAELILGGAGNGWNTTLVNSNIQLQLQFWNGHNYQEVTNAYSFGSNTLEGISNAQSSSQHYSENGTLYVQVSPGSGTLGTLYTQSQMGIVTVQSSINSGVLYVKSSSGSISGSGNSFTGQSATLTIFPGTYTFYVYSLGGTPFGRLTVPIVAGEVHSYLVSSSSTVALTLSYSVIGGGIGYSPPTLSYMSNGIQNSSTLTTSPSVYYVDQGGSWSITSTLGGSTSQERWTTNQTTSGSATSPQTMSFAYYNQYLAGFNFTVIGGGTGYSLPSVTVTQFGGDVSITVGQSVWVDAGSHYSYGNLLNGSTQSERWTANSFTSGQVQSATVQTPEYYHQFAISAEFSVSNGGTPTVGPTFTYLSFGKTNSSSLTTAPTSFWIDAGSTYSFASNVTKSLQERWVTNSSNSGTVTSSLTLDPMFTHQYYVTMQPAVQSAGTVNPQSEWVNGGSSLTISNSANPGWKFEMWNGTGPGSYTGSSSTTTVTIEGPIVESGIFYAGLTIAPAGSGSISYSFGSTSSSITSTETVYVPVGTAVTLSANPASFFDKMDSWSGDVSGSSAQTALTVQSPKSVQAQFGLNFITIGVVILVIVILVAAVAAVSRRRKNTVTP